MIPQKLIDIKNYLKEQNLILTKNHSDGRVNSIINEGELLKILISKFSYIQIPKERNWFDFSFEENNQFYPVNIKICTTKTTDNLSAKAGIYFALTGTILNSKSTSWEKYLYNLYLNIKETESDYYFLVFNKDDNQDIVLTSLKKLQTLVPNGSNPPFQCCWNKNRVLVERDFEESCDFILGTLGKTLKLKADGIDSFRKYFSKYLC